MPVLIPIDNQSEAFDFSIELEELVYRFSFRWNDRTEYWVFDVFTDENVAVQTGNPFFVDIPLLYQNQKSTVPPGRLMAINTQDTGVDADRWSIGGNVKLYYYTVAELAATQSSTSEEA